MLSAIAHPLKLNAHHIRKPLSPLPHPGQLLQFL